MSPAWLREMRYHSRVVTFGYSMGNSQNRSLPVATIASSQPLAPLPPRNLWAKAALVFGGLASAVAVVSGIALGGIWIYNSVVERGRELEKTDQLARGLTELHSATEQLATAQSQIQHVRAELSRLITDKETLTQQRDSLRVQLDSQQAEVLRLTRQLTANDNCSFVHRQIEAAQRAVDNHHPFVYGGESPGPEYLRKHQILLDRLKEYQNQLGQCSGRPTTAG